MDIFQSSKQKSLYLASSFSPVKLITKPNPLSSSTNNEFLQIYPRPEYSPIHQIPFLTEDILLDKRLKGISQQELSIKNEEISKKIIEKAQEIEYWKKKYQDLCVNNGSQNMDLMVNSQEILLENEKKIRLLIEENEYLKGNIQEMTKGKNIDNDILNEKITKLEEGIQMVLSENDKLNAAMEDRLGETQTLNQKLLEYENKSLSYQQENGRLLNIISEKDEEIYSLLEEKIWLKEKKSEEYETLSLRIQDFHKEKDIYSKRYDEIYKEKERMMDELESLKRESELYSKHKEASNGEKEALMTQINTISKENEAYKIELDGNYQELEGLYKDQEKYMKEIESLKEKLRLEKLNVIKNAEKYAHLLEEKTNLITNLQNKTKQDFEGYKELERKMTLLLENNNSLLKFNEENQRKISLYEEQIARLSQDMIDQEVYKHDLMEAKSLIQEKEENIHHLSENLKESDKKFNDLKEDYEILINNLQEKTKENDRKVKDSEIEKHEFLKKMKDFEDIKKDLKGNVEMLIKRNEEIYDALKVKDEENKSLLIEKSENLKKLKIMIEINEAYYDRFIDLKKNLGLNERFLKEINNKYREIIDKNMEYQREKEYFNGINEEKQGEIEHLKEDLRVLLGENKRILERFEEKRILMENYQTECNQLISKCKDFFIEKQSNSVNPQENINLNEEILKNKKQLNEKTLENHLLKEQIRMIIKENKLLTTNQNSINMMESAIREDDPHDTDSNPNTKLNHMPINASIQPFMSHPQASLQPTLSSHRSFNTNPSMNPNANPTYFSFNPNQNINNNQIPINKNSRVEELLQIKPNEDENKGLSVNQNITWKKGNYEEINDYVEKLRRDLRELRNPKENNKNNTEDHQKIKEIRNLFEKVQGLKKGFIDAWKLEGKEINVLYEEINGKITKIEEDKENQEKIFEKAVDY